MSPEEWRQLLAERLVWKDRTGSTNDDARELALGGAPAGTVVVAEEQTAGRGRKGAQWFCAPGEGLAFSVVLAPEWPREQWAWTALGAGVAVCEALEQVGLEPEIKWPNDVLLNERKVAGILTEQISVAGLPALIIGVGVNVNNSLQGAPDDVQQRATSVFDVTGGSIDLTELLISILNAIDQSINELGGRSRMLLSELNRHSVLNGRTVKLQAGETLTTGLCHGIDEGGALVLLTDVCPTSIIAGTVLEW